MEVRLAHYQVQGQHVAVFEADHQSHLPHERDQLLAALIIEAHRAGLRVDKAALAFVEWGRPMCHGARDLVAYLRNNGLPGPWNRRLYLY